MPGPSEWVIIAIVAIVVIFGVKKVPEIARSLGRSQSEFKKGVKEGQAELGETQTTPPPAQAPVQAQAQETQPQAAPPEEPKPEAPASG